MNTHIVLTANLAVYCFHLGGHLLNSVVNLPNWSSGTVEDMQRYSQFYHRRSNASFFGPVVLLSIVVGVGALLLVWNSDSLSRCLAMADLAISLVLFLIVLAIFRPMNIYFSGGKYEAKKLAHLVHRWKFYNRIRLVLVTAGFVVAVLLLNQ